MPQKESTVKKFGYLMYVFSKGDFRKWRESLERLNAKDLKYYTKTEFDSIQNEF